jgi:hypothetical protein
MTLGKKRNIMHSKSIGEFIVYMDDDDYYPPERVSHSIETLKNNPMAMIAGSSEMYIYFRHINCMYKFGPYGEKHATAATFAFRRELLNNTSYEDDAALAEEKHFLKNYTIPLVQLDPIKTILVFSHSQNSFDKKELLKQPENDYMKKSDKKIEEFIKDENIKDFFINKLEDLLKNYDYGKIEYKPEVIQQIKELTEKRLQMQMQQLSNGLQQLHNAGLNVDKTLTEQNKLIQILMRDNYEIKKRLNILEEGLKKSL